MENENEVRQLIKKFEKDQLSKQELSKLEQFLVEGLVDLSEFKELEKIRQMIDFSAVVPSDRLDTAFYKMLADQKRTSWSGKLVGLWDAKPFIRWAYSLMLIVIGVISGWMIKENSSNQVEINQLSAEVQEMKEMMMLSLLEEESISDRLKAVGLSSEIPEASRKITEALLKTLNEDDNVNVRLAALEALFPYTDDTVVRLALIESISKQESPLVQMALAEMMLALQEKRSVNALKDLLENQNTPLEVKEKINETLNVLI